MSIPSFSVKNPVIVNLLMVVTLVAGAFYGGSLTKEMFPETTPSGVRVRALWPGASPLEVERGVCLKIEERVKGLDNVDEIRATATEDGATIILQLPSGSTAREVERLKLDVEAEIEKISDLPEEVRDKVFVSEANPFLPVIALVVFGDASESRLKQWGERIRDDLLEEPAIDNAVLMGTRPTEIVAEVSPASLRRYGLTFDEVARAIARTNLNLPAGDAKSEHGDALVRTIGELETAEAFEQVIVRTTPSGNPIRLRDVATVAETFAELEEQSRFEGGSSVQVMVFKDKDQDAIEIADTVKAYRDKIAADLDAEGLGAAIHTDLSKYIEQRIDLMSRNAAWGLLLVGISLVVFLELTLAFWVAMGLVVSFFGTFVVMYVFGVTINLITLFGMIVVLGMIVDDAIVVGENAYRHLEAGASPHDAAIRGTEEVFWPVTIAVMTTIAAFLPIMLMEGQMGDFMRWLPTVVAAALLISLVEGLFIMPSHLAEWMRPRPGVGARASDPDSAPLSRRDRLHAWKRRYVHEVPLRYYTAFAKRALRYRYAATFVSVCILGVVLSFASGFMKMQLLPEMDSDRILIDVTMPVGTTSDGTRVALAEVEAACVALPEKLTVAGTLGSQMRLGHGGAEGVARGSHLAQLWLELVEPEHRERSSVEITAELRDRAARIQGVDSVSVQPLSGGPVSKEIEIEVAGDDLPELIAASAWLQDQLGTFQGVKDIEDSHRPGKPEFRLSLTDEGRALGLTVDALARQVRGAFFGLEASQVQRQREEVKVYVRFPPEARRTIGDVESVPIATPQGGLVPLREVADVAIGRSPVSITRRDQHRTIVVTADVDKQVANSDEVTAAIEARAVEVDHRWPTVDLRFKGARLEQQKSVGSLKKAFGLALLIVYALLAGVFRSYVQPLIVMSAIPFGLIGVVVGHQLLGYQISMPSLIGAVALTGIVVNDSLILVDFMNTEVRGSAPGDAESAVLRAARIRMRPIILTTVTTVLGLLPMLTETSLQARFLIPMAVSLTFGLIFATLVTLIVVPCLYLILGDLTGAIARARAWTAAEPGPAAPSAPSESA